MKLRFLSLEDNPLDAEMIEVTLLNSDIDCELQRVDTRADFINALETAEFDLILADYSLPNFDGLSALNIAHDRRPDIPFLFVSGSLGEEVAIEALKQGATDYVLKQRLSRLVPCVQRALQEAQERRERLQAEAALRESETRLRMIIESAKEYAIFTLDLDNHITSWNAGATRLLGYAEAEILGQSGRLIFTPEDNAEGKAEQELHTALTEGQSENRRWHVRKDGSCFWSTGFVMPLRDAAETVQGFIKIMRDETAQRQAEERFQLLYNTTSDLLATEQPLTLMHNLFSKLSAPLSLDYAFNYIVEPKADRPMLHLKHYEGLAAAAVSAIEWLEFGQDLCGLVAQERQQILLDRAELACHPNGQLYRQLGATAYAGQPLIVRGRLLGTLCFASCCRTHFTSDEADLLQTVCDQMAIALERNNLLNSIQQQAEQLERANQIKDEFLAVVSHELRSPLNPILGWAKLLRQGNLNSERAATALEIIERNAQLQAQLISDLLDISRILRGKLSLDEMPVDLSSVITGAFETVRLAAEAKHIHFRIELNQPGAEQAREPENSPPTIRVMGDAARLQQVVWNLLSNAVKFTPPGGQVDVKLEQVESANVAESPSYAQITVTDTGKGITPDFLPYVFDHFRQEDGATTRRFGGLGLGLAIARQIVEMHGGHIRVDSPGEDQGATFTVQLPLWRNGKSVVESRENKDNSPHSTPYPPLTGVQILVVDDEPDSREFVTFVLEQAGATVISVASGIEALQRLEQSAPSLIISDIGMPDLDGYGLLQQIRLMEQAKLVPAIALTAYAGEFDRQQAFKAGFQHHITKPAEPETLVKTVATLTGKKSSS
jgi:PAS domain S-box-containing protein